MTLDDLLDEGGAVLLEPGYTRRVEMFYDLLRKRYTQTHHCSGCSGSHLFCPRCDYLMSYHHEDGTCPDETEARERWGR